jgi:hypothetical protein
MINEWISEALLKRGIRQNQDGSFDICFFGDKIQHVADLDTAIRQQKHILDQQRAEQKENEEIGILMKEFHDIIVDLPKKTIAELGTEKQVDVISSLNAILKTMSKKTNDLRKDGHARLSKVLKMVENNNLPAANLSSQAALDRMRRRWLVNEKVIDKSLARLAALKELK